MKKALDIPAHFETVVTLEEDVTCFGNRFFIQLEDSQIEDHSFLKPMVGKKCKAVVMLLPICDSTDAAGG